MAVGFNPTRASVLDSISSWLIGAGGNHVAAATGETWGVWMLSD